MADVEPQQIGSYSITRLLGDSSTGRLYLGRQQQRKKDAAIKVLHTPLVTTEAREAFLARAKLLKTKLRHRYIAEVQDFGIIGEQGYLAMQYVSGGTIAQRFAPGICHPPDEVKRVLSPIADALHYAHVNNILHGNLQPGNLLISERKDVLLTDFSLLLASFDSTAPAYPYRAPEHLRGRITAASDQYSLAVLVYEWLCGRRPYKATERETLVHQQEHEAFPLPHILNSAISQAVERVLLQALAFNQDERFPHTQAFADAYLRALMGLPIQSAAQRITPSSSTPVIGNTNVKASLEVSQFIAPLTVDDIDMVDEDEVRKNDGEADFIPPLPDEGSGLQDIVAADLRQGGILSQSLPGYEERPAQIEMAALVAQSLMEKIPAIVEAATGTGKSLAYLLPIVRSNKVAIISTANKALQEQLFYKDIPFVQKHIKYFPAALVKGMGNYLCLDRMENERQGIQYYVKNRDFLRLINITEDPESSFNGDFETLEYQLPAEIRSKVHADSDQCAWSKCNFFSECYVRKMRLKAANAQVMVVNHTLLLIDAAMDGFLLPDRDLIIVDEAHHLEEEATRAFTITISQARISTLLTLRMLKDHSLVSLQDEAAKAMADTWRQLELEADPGFKGRANLHSPLEEGLKLASIISDLGDSLRKQRPKDMPEKESQLYDKLLKRTENLALDIRMVFSVGQQGKFVYYVERVNTPGRRGGLLEVSAAPLDITSWLKKQLFSKSNVICTSATLATIGTNPARPDDKGPNFAYFRSRTGLDYADYPNLLERILPLTFDYEHNALLYLPRHLPEPMYGPESTGYMKAIALEMERLVEASRGRAFLLFSSKRMLDQVYEEFCNLLPRHLDFSLLRQGDLPRQELTRRFRAEEGAVLFGLKSFWEGVDIAGEALSLVVIDKLPFDPPDDPVHEARVAQMKAAGENWFGSYVLPQAVLRLKQGLGRLLRTSDDRGVMAILDTRLYTKGYGKLVINALPPARRTTSLRDIEQFFAGERAAF